MVNMLKKYLFFVVVLLGEHYILCLGNSIRKMKKIEIKLLTYKIQNDIIMTVA